MERNRSFPIQRQDFAQYPDSAFWTKRMWKVHIAEHYWQGFWIVERREPFMWMMCRLAAYPPTLPICPRMIFFCRGRIILDNVCLYGKLHGHVKEAREQALQEFEAFGLKGYEQAYPYELSGGMRQRAAFLRTALCSADILLLDEPFGALDVITRNDMQDWLLKLRSELNRTMLLVTHDIEEDPVSGRPHSDS